MATITLRKRADGTTAYRASIRLKSKGEIIHAEAKTFDQRRLAQEWAKRREIELQQPGALAKAKGGPTLDGVLDWYLTEFGSDFGRTKRDTLKLMRTYELAERRALQITASDLIEHVRERRKGGASPATALNDMIWMRVLYRSARPALGLDLDVAVIEDAIAFCRAHKLIARPEQRERRPTPDELQRLSEYFSGEHRRYKIPMHDVMWFAVNSGRREAEITRLQWSDNDEVHHTGVVRDLKHPRKKEGNHREFKYTAAAWDIVKRQPKNGDLIFPYNPKTISAAFTRACHFLEIEDLKFHDLRHEATSRLFEAGYAIHEVAQFTLHDSWQTLKRYTHLSPKSIKHR